MTAGRFSIRPLYLQLRDALLDRIAAGEWRPGATIPNENDLAQEFGVSPGTVRKALDLLESERVLTRRQGRGTFVNDQGSSELAHRFSNIVTANDDRIVACATPGPIVEDSASPLDCARLRLGPEAKVYRIRRVLFHARHPLMVEDARVPADLFPGLPEQAEAAKSVALLAKQYGLLLGNAEERIAIGAADKVCADDLKLTAGSPILVLDRVVATVDGRAIEWRVGYCNPGNRHYVAKIG
jgi:GntR family transcriptional regulator